MRRATLLTILALALPAAALANSIDYTTGTFKAGTITRTISGGFAQPDFKVGIIGTLDSIVLSTMALSPGCNTRSHGSCTFNSGTVTVKNLAGAVLFTDSLDDGSIVKTSNGALISAQFLPNAMTTKAGFVHFVVSFSPNAPFTDILIGGTAFAVSSSVIPEPSALLLFGTGVGLAEMMRRKLKLRANSAASNCS